MATVEDAAVEVAAELARAAGAYAAEVQEAVVEEQKHDSGPSLASRVVTAVDREVERRLDKGLAAAFPDDGVLGEEYVKRPSRSGRTWLLDPIDGTLNYARRLGPWSVVLSAWDEYVLAATVVWTGGHLYVASAGGGAFRDGVALALPEVAGDPDGTADQGALVLLGPDLAAAGKAAGFLVRSVNSSAAELAAVADGRVAGTVRPAGHPRDLHGPALLVAEAGGIVTDLAGAPPTAAASGLVVARAAAHPALLALAAHVR